MTELAAPRTRDADRLAAAEPAEDRPHPAAGMGGSAQGADRRAARRGRVPSGRGRPARARRGGRAGPGGCADGGPPRRARHERRKARRDRADRQGGRGPLASSTSFAGAGSRPGSCSSRATSSDRSAACRGVTRSCSCPRPQRATAVSVGAEPTGVPTASSPRRRPGAFLALLDDQLERRRRGDVPEVDADPPWTLDGRRARPQLERVHDSLLTLADGRIGTRGSVLLDHPALRPASSLAGRLRGRRARDGPCVVPRLDPAPGRAPRGPAASPPARSALRAAAPGTRSGTAR